MDRGPLKAHKVQCGDCRHWKRGTKSCEAFPNRIPNDILMGDHDHKKPYPDDNGIRF